VSLPSLDAALPGGGGGGRAVPLLGDMELDLVQSIEHVLDAGFVGARVAGLDGEVQQRSGRPSHRIRIRGELMGTDVADRLTALQQAASAGEELTFAADITTALELQHVVVTWFAATQVAGVPHRCAYEVHLAESPPLPPPASLDAFGGLDDFGLGDLGFDTDILGDIADLAGDVASAVDQALDAVAALQSLAALAGGLPDASGLLGPLAAPVEEVARIGETFRTAGASLGGLFGGGP
jgi:hypothetical protein